jgi:hypothetical protein
MESMHYLLRNELNYSPESGEFRWAVRRRGVQFGAVAGRVSKSHGYRDIGFMGEQHRAHRLAFMYMLGRWPVGDVDHIDGDKANNSWANLRECTRSQNCLNVDPKALNVSGFVGVSWDAERGKWLAQIRISGKKRNLGRYATLDEAREAWTSAAENDNPEFRRAIDGTQDKDPKVVCTAA